MRLMGSRKLYVAILAYAAIVMVIYLLPIGLEVEWYDFYSYLDRHQAFPYVDTREGYPPLGFLIYMPLYYAFRTNATAFYYAFRALNGLFLVLTVYSLYHILSSMFDEKKAMKLTLLYGFLPSVLKANTYSNDVIAMLPTALAILMMVRKRSLLCGILIGLATLGKGFPLLLLIPAFFVFDELKDRVKVIGLTLTTLVLGSLPFTLLNPFTYISTFTHHGSRGPWETPWALIDGFYSHGGLLHPYFDKFFYHSNLLQVYDPSPFDNAIYAWRLDWLPLLLTVGEISVVLLLSLAYRKRKNEAVALCGLLYLGYMLFFKGYSTQFAVSTEFYVLLATMGESLVFLVPLEASHIMQMMSWGASSWHLSFSEISISCCLFLPSS